MAIASSANLLTSLTAEWYGVMWEIAHIMQGLAMQLSVWVISSWLQIEYEAKIDRIPRSRLN